MFWSTRLVQITFLQSDFLTIFQGKNTCLHWAIFRMRTRIRIRIRIRIYGNDDANKIESENVCITDADPHTDVRTLWKHTLILSHNKNTRTIKSCDNDGHITSMETKLIFLLLFLVV